MRNIKFRAYIKDTNKRVPSEINKIVEVKSLHLGSRKAIIGYSKSSSNYGNYSISFDDIELMQYTGLHDKNGKEIYEGDIIEFSYDMFVGNFDTFVAKGVVVFDEGAFYVELFENERTTKDEAYLLYSINLDTIEVIGNKFDNPDLLEKGAEE